MKLLVVTTSYPLSQKAISGIFVKRLNQALGEELDVSTVCPDSDFRNNSGVAVARYAPKKYQLLAHQPGGIPVAIKKNKLFSLLIPSMLFSMFLSVFIKLKSADYLLSHWAINGLLAGVANVFYRRPSIVVFHGSDAVNISLSGANRFIAKLAIKLNVHTVGVSLEIVQLLKGAFPNYAHKIHFVPNGVDESLLNLPRVKSGNIELTTIANLNPLKGVQDIIRAIARLDDERIVLNVVGGGVMREKLERLAQDLHVADRVIFYGVVSPSLMPGFLAKTDIFVLASYSEGRPSVVLEAMAAGKPIIASNISGNSELVTHGLTGLLFEVGNIQEIADCVALLCKSKNNQISMGDESRNFIINNKLLWKQTAQKYIQLYEAGVLHDRE